MSDPNVSTDLINARIDQCTGFLDEAKELADRKKEWRAEVKGEGLDPALIEKVAKLRQADPDKIAEEEAILDIYKRAAGVD